MREKLTVNVTAEIRSHCLCFLAQRAARAMAQRFDNAFRDIGLTNGQFSFLISLNRPAAPRVKDVASTLGMDETTVTAALKPLARRGLAEIRPDPGDARTKRLFLTAAGTALLERAVPIWRATHEGMERSIGSRDHRKRFRNDLVAVGTGRNV